MNLAKLAFRNSRGILLLTLFLSVLGALVARRMPAAILPDFPFPRLVVIAGVRDMAKRSASVTSFVDSEPRIRNATARTPDCFWCVAEFFR